MWGYIVGEPDVASYCGMVPDGDAAEDGGIGIYGDMVFDDGVAGLIYDIALLVILEVLSSEGDTLV